MACRCTVRDHTLSAGEIGVTVATRSSVSDIEMDNFYRGEEARVSGIVSRLTPVAEPPVKDRGNWTSGPSITPRLSCPWFRKYVISLLFS